MRTKITIFIFRLYTLFILMILLCISYIILQFIHLNIQIVEIKFDTNKLIVSILQYKSIASVKLNLAPNYTTQIILLEIKRGFTQRG